MASRGLLYPRVIKVTEYQSRTKESMSLFQKVLKAQQVYSVGYARCHTRIPEAQRMSFKFLRPFDVSTRKYVTAQT